MCKSKIEDEHLRKVQGNEFTQTQKIVGRTCQGNQSSLAWYYQLLPPFLERWYAHCEESDECSTTEMGKMGVKEGDFSIYSAKKNNQRKYSQIVAGTELQIIVKYVDEFKVMRALTANFLL